MLLLVFFISMSYAQIPSETCCQTKQVGDQIYTLVGTNDTEAEELGCMDNCIYNSYSEDRNVLTKEMKVDMEVEKVEEEVLGLKNHRSSTTILPKGRLLTLMPP